MRQIGKLHARALIAVLMGLATFASTAPTVAAETVSRFRSDITVRTDGALEVIERITVNVAHDRTSRHSFFRDFTTRYEDWVGNKVDFNFKVKNVRLDGNHTPYTMERQTNGWRLHISYPYSMVRRGEYTYKITYEITRQLTHLPKTDELYFNITGNGWDVAIDSASAIITLPEGAKMTRTAAYTGRNGSRASDATLRSLAPHQLQVHTDGRLGPGADLTVLLEWQAGVVTRPTTEDKAVQVISDNGWMLVGALGVLITFLYGVKVWHAVGRGPKAGVVIARYSAPIADDGTPLSPAVCRFVSRMSADATVFTAAVISMVAKGLITIEETDDIIALKRVGERVDTVKLTSDEAIIAREFFEVDDSTKIGGEYDRTFIPKLNRFFAVVRRRGNKYFLHNYDVQITIALVALFSLWSMAAASYWLTWALVTICLVAVYCFFGEKHLKVPIREANAGFSSTLMMLTSMVLAEHEIRFLPYMLVFCVLELLLTIIFAVLIPARTKFGRQMLDEIEGLKLYMSVAGKERLNFHNPPERTPEHYEALLPYAVALDVEAEWSDKFDDVLGQLAKKRGKGE